MSLITIIIAIPIMSMVAIHDIKIIRENPNSDEAKIITYSFIMALISFIVILVLSNLFIC